MKVLLALTFILAIGIKAHSAGGTGSSVGGGINVVNSSQDDMNTLISAANTREGGITTAPLGSAWEFNAFYQYRWGLYALVIRPAFFYQSSNGGRSSGTNGQFNYKLMGFSLFPYLRLIPLENSFIKFYMQIGLGYGSLSGSITEDDATVSFSGGAFGFSGGIGANFCFTDAHCMYIEGNYRYLPISRNEASSQSGTWGNNSLTQPTGGSTTYKEVELANRDLATSMSGVVGSIGYQFNF